METFSITPMISVRPNRISFVNYKRRIQLNNFEKAMPYPYCVIPVQKDEKKNAVKEKKQLIKKFHHFNISKNSQRHLKDKITYLFQFAKSRRIKTYSGKTLPNFKVCFLTLTLPSTQVHNSATITNECLDDFLQVLRKRLKMNNYVWRLEFQSNGNIHYHIATDCYVDYFFALKHWNTIINKLGYVNRYAEKMNKINYNEYANRYSQGGKIDKSILWKRWVKGKSSSWKNPNTVDVKNAKSSDNIAWYISKYFSKKEKGAKCNALDNEKNSFALRLSFWSRSLSRCKSESMPFDYYNVNWYQLCEECEEMLRCVYDYCRVYYYSFFNLPAKVKRIIGEFFNQMRTAIAYIPSS